MSRTIRLIGMALIWMLYRRQTKAGAGGSGGGEGSEGSGGGGQMGGWGAATPDELERLQVAIRESDG